MSVSTRPQISVCSPVVRAAWIWAMGLATWACGGGTIEEPLAPPPVPQQKPPETCQFPSEPYRCGDGEVIGLYFGKGKNGEPTITAGCFRRVSLDRGGGVTFDLQWLQKLKGSLGQQSTIHDFVMRMENSQSGVSPDLAYVGYYKLVSEKPFEIQYADVVETSWACAEQLPCEISSECMHVKPGMPRPDDGDEDYPPLCDHSSDECTDECTAAKVADVRKICDPSGKLLEFMSGIRPHGGYGVPRLMFRFFAPSTNPLYPAPAFYSELLNLTSHLLDDKKIGRGSLYYYMGDPEMNKNGFQIWWLFANEKYRATGSW